jgi:antitoxin (DNA-binding transcriptional repressor) of toxin-antitoxin stability system
MQTINLEQAQASLAHWVEAIEQGQEREIVIERNGQAAAKLVPVEGAGIRQRIGVAKGLFEIPDNIDAHNDEIARLFLAGTGV